MWKGLEKIIEKATSKEAINVLQNSRSYLTLFGILSFMYGILSDYNNPLRATSLYFSATLALEIAALYGTERVLTWIRHNTVEKRRKYVKVKWVV